MKMHHKSPPVRNWREFAREVGIIVLCVFIALAAGQIVDAVRWHDAVADGREALHREMAFDGAYFRDRITVASCIGRRLGLASSFVEAAVEGKRENRPFNAVGPGRLTLMSEWRRNRLRRR